MLISAPYSQAYGLPLPEKKHFKKGAKFTVKTVSDVPLPKKKHIKKGVKGVSSLTSEVAEDVVEVSGYLKYAESGLKKSKKLAKKGYGYSLSGIKYTYKKKDDLYYVETAEKYVIHSLGVAKDYAGKAADLPTVLPIVAQTQRIDDYLEGLTVSAAKELKSLGISLEKAILGDAVSTAKEFAVRMCLEPKYMEYVPGLSTVLPVFAQKDVLNYLERLMTSSSTATKFDKAMDMRYLQTYLGGGNHRLFDGGHTLTGAWRNIAEMCDKTECSTHEQVNGYFGALWKDAVTPKGLPLMGMEKQTYDSLANKLKEYGIDKDWTYDALSYDAMEIIGAGIAAAAVVYFLKEGQIEQLSEALGAMGITSIVSANPLMALVMISSVAYVIATETDISTQAVVEGVVKTSIISGVFVLLPATFLLQTTAAAAIGVLLEVGMQDRNYKRVADFTEKFTMERIGELKTWSKYVLKKGRLVTQVPEAVGIINPF